MGRIGQNWAELGRIWISKLRGGDGEGEEEEEEGEGGGGGENLPYV